VQLTHDIFLPMPSTLVQLTSMFLASILGTLRSLLSGVASGALALACRTWMRAAGLVATTCT